MAALPQEAPTVAAVYEWWRRSASDGFRDHLGCSLIGHECLRFLWLTFRWARRDEHDGRIVRLFDRGQREEEVIFRELRGAGIDVSSADDAGRQWTVSAARGHVGGSMDAAAKGFPEDPYVWHVVECKTHGDKSHRELVKNGVQKSKPLHYAQMQAYMLLSGMKHAMYIAVNKNDDNIYAERVDLDAEFAERLIDRAAKVVDMPEPPPRISPDGSLFVCKFCKFNDVCHGDQAPEPTCRSCAHSTPVDDGKWTCERHGRGIDGAAQRAGCGNHRFIPILLDNFAEMTDSDGDSVNYRNKESGQAFVNGPRPGYSSAEIAACADKRALGDADVNQLREEYDGTIVG